MPARVAMFYGSCPSACPMLIGDILAVEAAMTPQEREQVGEPHRSSAITLLDPQGRPLARTGGLRQPPDAILEALRRG